jgi:hypothetical protein
MSTTLDRDLPLINQENVANAKKRKRKSKSGMTAYTSSTRKSKKGSDENAGWSAEGKKLVCEIFWEINIREPEIAECSKNARICNILLEIFHIFFIFHKKNYFSIFVFVASVNLSICTNKSSFHNYFYTYPLFF